MPKPLTIDDKMCVTFHAPISLIQWMDRYASSRCMTRSTLLRGLVLDLQERIVRDVPSTATSDTGTLLTLGEIRAKAAGRKGGAR